MANTISISVVADVAKMRSGLASVENDLGKLGAASSKAGSFIGSSLKTAALGIAGVGIAVGGFALSSVKDAVDLNETISKTETIFGKSGASILKWSESTATSMGLSQNEALTAVSSFGNLYDQLGFTGKQSATMGKQFVGVAADMASFHNAAPVDVLDALQAATRGEYDALQKYVPTINAAAVQQEAMAQTGKTVVSSLTDQDKALALNSLVMKGQGKAAGDFERTSGSLANQQRILTAEFANVKAGIGQALLPVMLQLMGVVRESLLPQLEKFSAWFKENGPAAIDAAVAAFTKFLEILKPIAAFIVDHWQGLLILVGVFYGFVAALALVNVAVAAYRAVMTAVAIAQGVHAALTGAGTVAIAANTVAMQAHAVVSKAVTAAQWLLNAALTANPIGLVIVAIVALVAIFVIAWKNSETFRDIVLGAWEAIKTATSAVWDFVKGVLGGVWDWISTAGSAAFEAVKGVIVAVWDAISGATGTVWNAIKTTLETVWNFISSLVLIVFNAYKTVILEVWNAISTATSAVWNAIKGALTTVFEVIKNLVTTVFEGCKTIITTVWNVIKTVTTTVWDAIKGFLTTIFNAISTVATTVWNAIKGTITTVVNGINTVVTNVFNEVKGFVSTVFNAILTVATTVWNAVKGAVETAVNLIKTIVTTVFGVVRTTVETAFNAVKTIAETVWGAVRKAVETAVNAILTLVGGIKAKITTAFSGAKDLLVSAGKNIVEGLWNGISSLGSWIKDKMLAFVKNVIPGPVAKALGIASPSKLMRKFGRYTVQGLAKGITENEKMARNASASLAGAVSSGFGDPRLSISGLTGNTNAARGRNSMSVSVKLTAEQLSQLERGRMVSADLDTYRTSGGRVVA